MTDKKIEEIKNKYNKELDEIISKYNHVDVEYCHAECDRIMEEILSKIGFKEIVEKIKNTERWYA